MSLAMLSLAPLPIPSLDPSIGPSIVPSPVDSNGEDDSWGDKFENDN